MSHGPISVFSDSIASGASTSGGINLARAWKTVQLRVGTMSTAANLLVDATDVSGGSYYQVFATTINSATVATNPFVISQSVGTNGGITEIPGGFQFLRFRTTAVVSGGVLFKVICSD